MMNQSATLTISQVGPINNLILRWKRSSNTHTHISTAPSTTVMNFEVTFFRQFMGLVEALEMEGFLGSGTVLSLDPPGPS